MGLHAVICMWQIVMNHGYEHSTSVYPQKYAHGYIVLCFDLVMQSFILNSHEVFIQIHQGCFAGTGAIVRLPQCQWSKPDGYGKISQCITTTKHSKAKTVCIFLGIYCTSCHNPILYQWPMIHISNLMMTISRSTNILIIINIEIGQSKTHSPISFIRLDWDNGPNLIHTLAIIYRFVYLLVLTTKSIFVVAR